MLSKCMVGRVRVWRWECMVWYGTVWYSEVGIGMRRWECVGTKKTKMHPIFICCSLILSCGQVSDQRGPPQTNKPNNWKPRQIDADWSLDENQTTKIILCKCVRMLYQSRLQESLLLLLLLFLNHPCSDAKWLSDIGFSTSNEVRFTLSQAVCSVMFILEQRRWGWL